MSASPLHQLARKIADGEFIDDDLLLETLGRDGTIVVPLHGGSERRLPSGEILAVLADSAGSSVDQVLARSFRMDPEEIAAADEFIRLVQFAGEGSEPATQDWEDTPEQPFQPFDR